MSLDPNDIFAPIIIPEDKDDLDRGFAILQTWGQRLRELVKTGRWTPTDVSGTEISFVTTNSSPSIYAKIGPLVYVSFDFTYNQSASTTGAAIGFVPFVNDNAPAAVNIAYTTCTIPMYLHLLPNEKVIHAYTVAATARVTHADLSGTILRCSCVYRTPE